MGPGHGMKRKQGISEPLHRTTVAGARKKARLESNTTKKRQSTATPEPTPQFESLRQGFWSSDEELEQAERPGAYDDESDSEREPRLTAANIEGLSKKLDMEREALVNDAEAELQETIEARADEDETSLSQTPLGFSLLRQRISDTIRVLEDSAQRAKGISRADYTSQVLKDICDYSGHMTFL
jgi:hypothetical protein